MELYLIRHTRPDIGAGICYGQLDVDVTSGFASDAARIRAQIPAGLPVLSSPLRRCLKLADFLAPVKGVTVDARLMELAFGAWEGQSWDSIERSHLDHWAANFTTSPPPGGETLQQLSDRIMAFLTELRQDCVIVSHAGPIRVILAHQQGIPLQDYGRLEIPYGSVTRISWRSARGEGLQRFP